ncbi:MAG: MmgE/PrpD family protein [Xanthobacteraceae bacterium]
MAALTTDLGNFVAQLRLDDIPVAATTVAKTGFTDCFGVIVAGARQPAVALVDRTLSGSDGSAKASLIPGGARRNVEDAALVNGVAAHVLDYDDVTSDGHPSAVLVPAILAQGEACGSSGADMLTAYVAGYEVWAELLVREPVPLHQKGWHPTAVRGPIAAAAACAKLMRLGPRDTATALALAGSMASGLVANFGTLTKPFQVGRAAQSGLLAARLAAAGLTASPDALEHPSGYLAAFSPDGRGDRARPLERTGREWHLERQGLNIKRYPICYATHRAIDATLDLVQRHDLRPADVEEIQVSTSELQVRMLRNDRPQTGFEAKFSMQFALAASLVARGVGLQQLRDDFVKSPTVQALMPRVRCAATVEAEEGSAFARADSVEIRTAQGKTFASPPIRFAKGSTQSPLSREELWLKFSDCLGDDFAPPTKAKAFESLMTLDRLDGTSELLRL